MLGIVTVLGLDHPFVGAGDTSSARQPTQTRWQALPTRRSRS